MADHNTRFPIAKMSQLFGVSRSGYYRWLSRGPSARAIANQHLRAAIRRVWEASGRTYGSPRIHRQLVADGWSASRPRVARLMQAMGIQSQIRRKWKAPSGRSHNVAVAPNLLGRRFSPSKLGQVWVSDITYFPSNQGWLYLTTVMDLADRQILGWNLSRSMKAEETSMAAFRQAAAKRSPTDSLLFHSDRGIQYGCSEFTGLLAANNITQSMSRKGNCWDNAPAESFFKTLKAELQIDRPFTNYTEARGAVFAFIELWYNRKRLHSALDYQTPAQAEKQLTHNQAA